MNNTYVTLTVSGPDRNVQSFLQLCKRIEILGVVGSSDDIQVWVDGDGGAQLKFKLEHKELDFKDVLPAAYDDNKRKYMVDIE